MPPERRDTTGGRVLSWDFFNLGVLVSVYVGIYIFAHHALNLTNFYTSSYLESFTINISKLYMFTL